VTKKQQKLDRLDLFAADANADPRMVVQMLLWKDRHRNSEMSVQVTEKDLEGFEACLQYLEVKPEVKIFRPQGRPAQAPIPAQGKRRAVPGRAAEPARPYVAVLMVQRGTMDGFKPIENNEEDAKLRDSADEVRRARDKAFQLSIQMAADMRTNVFSTSTIADACQVLVTLARAA
jgi:hypothetical protein